MRSGSNWLSATVGVLAAVICAWFALGARQAHETDRASAILGSGSRLSRSRAGDVRSLLHDAGQLNPDTTVTILRAELAAEVGHRRQASRLLLGVVHEEPMNVAAWEALGATTTNHTTFVQSQLVVESLVASPGHG